MKCPNCGEEDYLEVYLHVNSGLITFIPELAIKPFDKVVIHCLLCHYYEEREVEEEDLK